ncbi:FixH family protein [Methylobacterium durans]|uniref:Nitrogen fixation protein FixH n=1 Tax=Methylobacterium durans TaxID=2202825 RepID=A0A2U8W0K8_9HYPH|nr:nitrogen fixation protein FixH [Methylobacterium durans]
MNIPAVPSRSASGFRLTGGKVLAIFIAFFGTIASADALLVTSAFRTWSGLEVASPYQASQRYNEELRLARRQGERGWHLESRTEREGSDGLVVAVTLRDRHGQPLGDRRLRARLERPTDKRGDLTIALAETTPGDYVAHLDAVSAGQWDLVVDVLSADGDDYRRKSRIVLR